MPTKKNDASPMLFFIDQIESPNFGNPILPMPLRIDRIIRKMPSLFVFPKKRAIISVGGKQYSYNYTRIFELQIENLLRYAEQKYRTLFFKQMELELVEEWWAKTKNLKSTIKTYRILIEKILQSYLEAFQEFSEGKSEKAALISHIDDILEFTNSVVEKNSIILKYKGNLIERNLYKKKNDHIFPDIFECDILNTETQKTVRRAFVPLFAFDDLLECYLYNKKLVDPDGYAKLKTFVSPEEIEEQEAAKNRKWWQIFKFPKKKEKKQREPNPEPEENPSEPPNLISFQSVLDAGIIVPFEESMSDKINASEILHQIKISEIFSKII